MADKGTGTIRIVAGQWRGRKLAVPEGEAIRPTGERQRKALFDILGHGRFAPGGVSCLQGARVLDVFAGTGALGLEALPNPRYCGARRGASGQVARTS